MTNPKSNKGDTKLAAFISSEILKGIFETAQILSIDLKPFLSRYHIRPELLQAGRGVVEFSSVVDMLEDIAKQTNTEDFGLRLGIQQPPLHFGLLTEILTTSPNVGAALHNALRHAHVYNQSAHWNLRYDDNEVVLFRHFKIMHPRPITQHLSLSVCVMYKALKHFGGESWRSVSIHFTQDPPVSSDLYRTFFKAPLYFNSDFTGIAFDRSTMDIKIPTSNPNLLKILTQHLEAEHSANDDRSDIEVHLQNYIRSQIGTGFNRLSFFARHIGVHPRKIQRMLAAENLSFRETLTEIKCDIAQHYLINSSSSLAEISFILGYENVSAFSRAFTLKTNGVSPSQFRLNRIS